MHKLVLKLYMWYEHRICLCILFVSYNIVLKIANIRVSQNKSHIRRCFVANLIEDMAGSLEMAVQTSSKSFHITIDLLSHDANNITTCGVIGSIVEYASTCGTYTLYQVCRQIHTNIGRREYFTNKSPTIYELLVYYSIIYIFYPNHFYKNWQ